MTDSEQLNLDPDNYDFTTSAITEEAYYDVLDTLQEPSWVTEVTHSLPLNSIRVTVDASRNIIYGPELNAFPEEVRIRKAYISDGDLVISLRTTKWLHDEESSDENIYTGSYSDEAMAYLTGELELFEEVAETSFFQPDNETELRVEVQFDEPIQSLDAFDELMTMGYAVEGIEVRDESITKALFAFDETRDFSTEAVTKFQELKMRNRMKERLRNSSPVTLPSGDERQPRIYMIGDMRDEHLSQYPNTVLNAPKDADVDTIDCVEVPVKDVESAVVKATDFPEGVEPAQGGEDSMAVTLRSGYGCVSTNTLYLFDADTAEDDIYGDTVDKETDMDEYTAKFEIDGVEQTYSFDILNQPARSS